MDKAWTPLWLMDINKESSNSFYLILVWILFSTSLRSSSSFVFRKLSYSVMLGTIAPFAYLGGQALGRIKYSEPEFYSVSIHSVIWILIMTALFYFNKKFPVEKK